jgi:hypothetical protein
MATSTEPLIQLEPGGKAPILSYDLPEPSIYFGRNFIELDYDDSFFTAKAKKGPPADVRSPLQNIASLDRNTLVSAIKTNMKASFADHKLFPNVRVSSGTLRLIQSPNPGIQVASSLPAGRELQNVDIEEIATMMQAGKRLNVYTSMFGTLKHNYIPEPPAPVPRLLLVETYRLASYLGIYGAGRVVKTFTLLPGERTKISIRTFLKSEEERKSASSILDSFTEESATDFEETVASEQSSRETYEKSFQYYAEAEAKASWGWGSAKVKGGVKGGTNSAREESAKNTANATSRHSQKASAKRDVEINTSYEVRETEEQEMSTERQIENINLSRTLNFVFRQMNQEFITILSLVDVRIAFFNGFPETRREVTLPELDTLLDEYIVAGQRAQVRQEIRDELETILDFEGNLQNDFIEERAIGSNTKYLRVRTERTSKFKDPITGTEIEAPGIIVSAQKNVMRTEGVIVEALLGVGDALDSYATRMQELEVERRQSEIAHQKAGSEREALLNDIVRDNDADRAKLLTEMTCPCGPENSGIDINLRHVRTGEGKNEPNT